jgi:hypothetical protein
VTATPKESAPKKHSAAVLLVTAHAPLFRDELARLEEVARKVLSSSRDLPVDAVPAAEIVEARALSKAGKLTKDGPVCAAPPTAEEVVAAAHPDLLVAKLDASCDAGMACGVSLRVTNGSYSRYSTLDGDTLVEAAASPTDPIDVASWETALGGASVEKPEPAAGGGVGIGIGRLLGEGREIAVEEVDARGAFSKVPVAADFSAEAARATKTCPATRWLTTSLLVEVNEDGKVARCEADQGAPACLCAAFTTHRFAAEKGKRRARFDLVKRGDGSGGAVTVAPIGKSHGRAPSVTISQRGGSYDESWEVGEARSKGLVKCFGADGPRLQIEVHTTLDERGHVTDVKLGGGALSEAEAKCVAGEAKRFAFRCPDHAGDRATTLFSVFRGKGGKLGGAHDVVP